MNHLKENRGHNTEKYREWLKNKKGITHDPKKILIEEIKDLVNRYGQVLTMGELEADSSPIYKDDHTTSDLIENLAINGVIVYRYKNDYSENHFDAYGVGYEDLELDTLQEIKDLIDNAIEFEFIEEDI